MFTSMSRRIVVTLSLAAATTATRAEERWMAAAPEQSPSEVCQNCASHRCVLVPEKKQIKKTVYEVQEVPYCLKKLPPLFGFHKYCDDCAECDCVRYKKVLVKKELVCCEIPTTKCVPQPCGK